MKKPPQPMQPIIKDKEGVCRFQENKIVSMLFDLKLIDLNQIAGLCVEKKIPKADQMQFWQMLGYSVSGFGDLSFAAKDTVAAADAIVEQLQTDGQLPIV